MAVLVPRVRLECAGCLIVVPEPVSDATNGLNVLARAPKLAPETDDLHIDGPLCHRVVLTVNAINDLIACEDPPRTAGQQVQEIELSVRELDALALVDDLAAARTDGKTEA